MSLKIDWVIHCVANGACDECNNIETGFCPMHVMRIHME